MNSKNKIRVIVICIIQFFTSNAFAAHENFEADYQYSYFINGLGSAIPEIGKGLDSLSSKIGGKYFAYITPIEGTLPITVAVISDVQAKLKHNPDAKFNIIGTSYGGNIATIIASQLNQIGANVNYLAVIDAPAPLAIPKNVHRVDNFVCRRIGCIGQKLRLEKGNDLTWIEQFKLDSNHIELSSNDFVQNRVIGQLTELPMDLKLIPNSKELPK